MCGLCGVFGGGPHWSDGAAIGARARTRLHERQHRIACLNAVLAPHGLEARDWQGAAYVLANRTGRSEIVDTLPHLWQAAEALLGRPIDPLDPALLARLSGRG